MTVSTPTPFSILDTSPIGARLPYNVQEAMLLHPMARTTHRLDTGGDLTEPIHILGGPLHFSTSHGHHRDHHLLDIVSRHNLGKAADLAGCGNTLWARRNCTGLYIRDNRSTARRMLKKATFSPAQPRRARTRRTTGKAAASEEARRYLPHFVRPFALAMGLGERKSPYSVSDLRETSIQR